MCVCVCMCACVRVCVCVVCVHVCRVRIQCLPGKMGRFESISARMQPMDQVSTGGREGEDTNERLHTHDAMLLTTPTQTCTHHNTRTRTPL